LFQLYLPELCKGRHSTTSPMGAQI